MSISPLAGKPVESSKLVNVPRLVTAYYTGRPDSSRPAQRVAFGTSGHRGSAFDNAFNEAHILAIAEAICRYRAGKGINGPLFLGMDTHALAEPAFATALEVLAANGVETMIDDNRGYTPTPAISHAILTYNRGRERGLADGIVITPSHNPPEDGGFKYNPPHGGPAESSITSWIERAANDMLDNALRDIKRVPFDAALRTPKAHRHSYIESYVSDLASVVDLDIVRSAGLTVGVDPLGGAGVHYWEPISERYGLNVRLVNDAVDPTFRFMTLDWDGKIRMDCSSPYAMAGLVAIRSQFDIAFANDTDSDRHGIVTRSAGLMNPNHYLAVAIEYLFSHRPHWPNAAAIGKTVVSSSIIDRVASRLGRRLIEVPVGFKWFVEGLHHGTLGFAGEESAGASFLRMNGEAWTTDKDGIIMGLLAAEITAREGRDPGEIYQRITRDFGAPAYERIDAAATRDEKQALQRLSADQVDAADLAGDPIRAVLVNAPGDGEPIGGLKVVTGNGWFAARPSGTEDVYKIYAESFRGPDHLKQIQREAQALVGRALATAKPLK